MIITRTRLLILAAAAVALLALAVVVYAQPFPPRGYGDTRDDELFSDCDVCPEMLPIAPGVFEMGDPPRRREVVLSWFGGPRSPRRVVTVERPFAIGRTEVTFDQWEACVAAGGCEGYRPDDEGWGRGDLPVIHVSWNHAQSYVRWLSEVTGETYRLPSDAEWEYAARAGTHTPYSWGKFASHNRANYGGPDCPPCEGVVKGRDAWLHTAPVGSFPPNAWGLHDVHGNVYEWVEDCHVFEPPAVATNAAPLRDDVCENRPMRGAAWYSDPGRIASHYRAYNPPEYHDYVIGFRVARDL